MAAPLEQWFFDVPVVTRWWTTAVVTTSVLCQCNILTPFQLFISFQTVWVKRQVRDHSSTRQPYFLVYKY